MRRSWAGSMRKYLSMFKANGNRYSKRFDDVVLSNIYDKIGQAEIWLPYGELVRYYYSKKKRFENRALKMGCCTPTKEKKKPDTPKR